MKEFNIDFKSELNISLMETELNIIEWRLNNLFWRLFYGMFIFVGQYKAVVKIRRFNYNPGAFRF